MLSLPTVARLPRRAGARRPALRLPAEHLHQLPPRLLPAVPTGVQHAEHATAAANVRPQRTKAPDVRRPAGRFQARPDPGLRGAASRSPAGAEERHRVVESLPGLEMGDWGRKGGEGNGRVFGTWMMMRAEWASEALIAKLIPRGRASCNSFRGWKHYDGCHCQLLT